MQALLNLFYPPHCPFCDQLQGERRICSSCQESIQYLEADFMAPHLKEIWFERGRSALAYSGGVVEALHSLKYSKRFDLLPIFTNLLVDEVENLGRKYDVVVPVPLHWRRIFGRGYNQSALLARSLAKRLQIECDLRSLKRIRHLPPQVGLSRAERLRNVQGVFALRRGRAGSVVGKKVLLIDDVLTTGATINECAKVLVKNGKCGTLDVLTIARTL